MSNRKASGAQLWRLNAEGRLRLVDEPGDPITSAQASPVIAAFFEQRDAYDVDEVGDPATSPGRQA